MSSKVIPRVVVFDLGKVLLDFDYSIAAKGLAARSRVSPAEIQAFIDHSPLLVQYEKGRITQEAFFGEIRQMSGYTGALEEFAALFSDVFSPIQPMIDLKKRLSAAGIPTYIFSNTNDLAITHIRSAYPFYNTFDGYVLSYEHGFMKPESELYTAVEELSGCSGPEILYFDDRLENIQAGARRQWIAVRHEHPEHSVKAALNAGFTI